MVTLDCSSCGKKYLQLVGHSCGDTVGTQSVRESLAATLLTNQKLEKELVELRTYLIPLVKHHAGEYNKWKHNVGKTYPGWIEALDYINSYVRKVIS